MRAAAEVFKRARAELAKRGLHKGSYFANGSNGHATWPEGPCDLYGAVFLGAGLTNDHDARSAVWNNYYRLIVAALPDDTELGPGKWMDQAHVTVDDVLRVLDRAAALAAPPPSGWGSAAVPAGAL